MNSVDEREEGAFLAEDGFTPFPQATPPTTTDHIQRGSVTSQRTRVILNKLVSLDRALKTLLVQSCLDPISSLTIDLQRFRVPTDAEWLRIEPRPGIRYYPYLESDEWKQRRQFMIRRAGYRCQICNGRGRLHVHHRTYERVGEERIDDLAVLCAECHALFHRHRRIDRR